MFIVQSELSGRKLFLAARGTKNYLLAVENRGKDFFSLIFIAVEFICQQLKIILMYPRNWGQNLIKIFLSKLVKNNRKIFVKNLNTKKTKFHEHHEKI